VRRDLRIARLSALDYEVLDALALNGQRWSRAAQLPGRLRLARPAQQLAKFYDLGLVERRDGGAVKPSFEYRISAEGRRVLASERADS
jgi:hypothetical protein